MAPQDNEVGVSAVEALASLYRMPSRAAMAPHKGLRVKLVRI